jgi:hypothetical protein
VCQGEQIFLRRVVVEYVLVDGVAFGWRRGRFTVIHAVGSLRVVLWSRCSRSGRVDLQCVNSR